MLSPINSITISIIYFYFFFQLPAKGMKEVAIKFSW